MDDYKTAYTALLKQNTQCHAQLSLCREAAIHACQRADERIQKLETIIERLKLAIGPEKLELILPGGKLP